MSGKHTPGPWIASIEEASQPQGNWTVWTRQPHTGDLATVHCEDINGEFPAKANARLISAAPDLLRAAQAFVAAEDALLAELQAEGKMPDLTGQPWALVDGLRSAIAKATTQSEVG